jgi:tetratricopeptide (TPR) repeat protein
MFARLFRGLASVGDAFEGIERLGVSLLRLLTWPFRAIGKAAASAVPQSVSDSIDGSATGLRRVAGTIARADESGPLDTVVRFFARVTWPVWRPLAAVGGFADAYLRTRNWRLMLWGLPAILASVPFLVLVVQQVRESEEGRATPYREAVQVATAAKDYQRVALLEQKLAQLGVDSRATAFRVAERFEREGDLQGARERMEQLATLDERGYGPAHWWMVDRTLRKVIDVGDADRQSLITSHLDRLKEMGVDSMPTALVRAILYEEKKDFAAAAEVLRPYSSGEFAAASMRMRMLVAAGRMDDAREQASVVANQVAAMRRTKREVAQEEYGLWAMAAQLRGDVALLDSVAQGWVNEHADSKPARELLASLRRQQFATLVESPSAGASEVARLLSESVRLGSPPEWVGRAVDRLLRPDQTSLFPARAIEVILRSKESPTALLDTVGAQLALRERYSEAAVAFRESVTRPDAAPATFNNHAYVLMRAVRAGEGDSNELLDEAFVAVAKALEAEPDSYSFRETRGQLLALKKDWRGAIDDLEYALNGIPGSSDAHQTLASAYEAIGDKELAAAHRAAVE